MYIYTVYLQYVFKNLFYTHVHTTWPTRKQMNGKQWYDSYGTRDQKYCCANFWRRFYISNLD